MEKRYVKQKISFSNKQYKIGSRDSNVYPTWYTVPEEKIYFCMGMQIFLRYDVIK